MKVLIWTLSIAYVLNCIISILQYNDSFWGWSVAMAINSNTKMELEKFTTLLKSGADVYSQALIPGLGGDVVINGYFASVFLPISTLGLFQKKNPYLFFLSLGIFCLGAYTIFIIQQRTAFVVFLLYAVLIFYYYFRKSTIFFILGAIIFGFIALPLLSNMELGRLSLESVGEDQRMNQGHMFSIFLSSEDMLWGAKLNNSLYGLNIGHNSILDSWRRGGIFCFILFAILFFKLAVRCIKVLIISFKKNNPYALIFSFSCLSFIIDSMFHSYGIQSGAPFFWICYAGMMVSLYIGKKAIEK